MKPIVLVACFVLLTAACDGAVAPTPTPAPSPTPPGPTPAEPTATPQPPTVGTPSPEARRWSFYQSQLKQFSMQLPSDWELGAGIPGEDVLLRIEGGAEGRLVVSEEVLAEGESFAAFQRRFFQALTAEDPAAVTLIDHQAGRVVRGIHHDPGLITVNYVFEPARGSVLILTFGWEQTTPHPIWEMIVQRFNPHSTRMIIPFGSPPPPG